MKSKQPDVSAIKWLRVAIASEKAALRDYLDYALQTRDKAGKDMFVTLARDEFHHMVILENERSRLQSGRAWSRWDGIKIPVSPIERILPLAHKNTAFLQEAAQSNESQALELALKAEKKAMEFYLAQSRKMKNPAACALLQRLAGMENAHYQVLQAELDNINKTGFWMGLSEISMEVE